MLSNFPDFKMTSTRYSQIEMLFPSLKIFATRRLMELVWDHQQYTNWCFSLTVLPECLLWRALCCPKDIPKCRNQLLFLDNVPLPLKLSIHHSVWTCLNLSQKIKLMVFHREEVSSNPSKCQKSPWALDTIIGLYASLITFFQLGTVDPFLLLFYCNFAEHLQEKPKLSYISIFFQT